MRFQHFEIEIEDRQLRINNQLVVIGARAFDVLAALAIRQPQVISKHDLMDIVWPDVVVEENNLQVQISTLRKLLGASAIATVPGRGYSLTHELLDQPNLAINDTTEFEHTETTHERSAAVSPRQTVGHFPAHVSKLYGRKVDVVAVTDLMAQHRLVTVTGSGGLGKTHLVKTVVSERLSDWLDGVWWLDVTTAKDAPSLIDLIAQTLRIGLANQTSGLEALCRALQSQRLLLVLDNCEHVRVAVQEVLTALLNAAPNLQVLATSQARLHVAGECVYQLEALRVPSPQVTLEQALQYGAIELFVARVQQLDRHFKLQADSLPAVFAICAQLDGVPLPLELAAARVPMLGVQGVLERLSERLRWLGHASAPVSRHATLRAALDWSYQLLDAAQAHVFRQLSVLSGSFSLDVAKRLLVDERLDEWTMLSLLESLIEHSLVVVDDQDSQRYRLLESHRVYALEQLQALGEATYCQQKLATVMVDVSLQFVKTRATQALWQEMNHIRASYDWATAQTDEPNRQCAITLATASTMVLAVSGFTHEALTRLLAVKLWVNAKTPGPIAARYWQWLGRCGVHGLLATSQCMEAFVKAEKLFQAMQDWRHVHACRRMRAEAHLDNQQWAEAKLALLEAQTMETPDWPVADRLRRLKIQALLSSQLGEHTTALRLAEEALSMAEMAGIERYVLAMQLDIADLYFKAGVLEEALTRYSRIVSYTIREHYHRFTVAQGYVGFMRALVQSGHLVQAASVCQQGLPHWRSSGIVLKHGDIFACWLAHAQQPLAAVQMLCAADAFFIRREVMRSAIEAQTRAAAMAALSEQVTASQLGHWLEIGPASLLEESRLLEELASQLERFLATH